MKITERFIRIVTEAAPPLCVVECGANNGNDTRWMIKVLLDSRKPFRYFAVEPDPRSQDAFKATLGNMMQYVTLVPCAIGGEDGESPFWISDGTPVAHPDKHYTSQSSIREPTKILNRLFPMMTFTQTTCRVITLDTLCRENQIEKIDFIWADIQGAEVDMIKGGKRHCGGHAGSTPSTSTPSCTQEPTSLKIPFGHCPSLN